MKKSTPTKFVIISTNGLRSKQPYLAGFIGWSGSTPTFTADINSAQKFDTREEAQGKIDEHFKPGYYTTDRI